MMYCYKEQAVHTSQEGAGVLCVYYNYYSNPLRNPSVCLFLFRMFSNEDSSSSLLLVRITTIHTYYWWGTDKLSKLFLYSAWLNTRMSHHSMRKKYFQFFIIRQAHLTIKVQKQPKFWESLQHFLAKIKYCETFYLQTISCGKAGRKKRVIFAMFLSLSNLKMTSKTFCLLNRENPLLKGE